VVISDQASDTPLESARPLRADAARNREKILRAAAEVFAERGLDATLDEVAERAGVGVATVYRRFPSKEPLISALFDRAVQDFSNIIHRANNFENSWEGLVWLLERASQHHADDFGLRDLMLYRRYETCVGHGSMERIASGIERLVERAQRDGYLRTDVVAQDFVLLQLMIDAVASRETKGSTLWRRYLDLFIDGLSTGKTGTTPLEDPPDHAMVTEILNATPRASKVARTR